MDPAIQSRVGVRVGVGVGCGVWWGVGCGLWGVGYGVWGVGLGGDSGIPLPWGPWKANTQVNPERK